MLRIAGGSIALCLAVAFVAVGAGTAAASTGTTLYAYPAGTGTATGGCTLTTQDCSLAAALAAAGTDAATTPVTVTLEPNPSGSGPQVFYGNWTLSGASAADPITLDGNGQVLDGDQGTVTGTCETASCAGPVLTVADGGTYLAEGLTIRNAGPDTPSPSPTPTPTPFTGVTNLTPVISPIQTVLLKLRTTVADSCRIPSLTGLSLSDALTSLTVAGCGVGRLYDVASVAAHGRLTTKLKLFKPTTAQAQGDTVSKLSPKPHRRLAAGATLQLSVSQVSVPG